VGERLAGPRLRQDLEDLVHRGAAPAHVRTQARVLDVRPPEPSPSASRPWLSSWTVAASSASRSGWCIGASTTPVPISMREVACAIAALTTSSEGM